MKTDLVEMCRQTSEIKENPRLNEKLGKILERIEPLGEKEKLID